MMAANATGGGSVVMLLIGLVIGFGLGYYTMYKRFESKNLEIVQQAKDNQELDNLSELKRESDNAKLIESLKQIGYSDSDVEFLITGEYSKFDTIKNKFTRFIKGDVRYLPRDDCEDDYVGEQSAKKINDLIRKAHGRRLSEQWRF